MQQLKTFSLCSLSLVLAACAGGGSFETLEVNPEPPSLPEPPKVEKAPEPRQNPEEQEALKQPAAGFVMKGLRRNIAKYDSSGKPLLDSKGEITEAETYLPLNPNNIEAVNDSGLIIPKLEEMQNDPANRNGVRHSGEDQKSKYRYIRFGHLTSEYPEAVEETVKDESGTTRFHTLRTGWNVYTFYHGTAPAPALPRGNVNYQGEWYFMSDVKKDKGKEAQGGFFVGNGFDGRQGDGNIASATGQSYQATDKLYSSVFNVDFDNKSMTGELHYRSKSEPQRKMYDIEAKLNGNRFTGKALSNINNSSPAVEKAFFSAHSNLLEGGFYGSEAQELAGKFLANDNSLFVVFGAKRGEDNPNQPKNTNALLDAYYLTVPKRIEVEYEHEEKEENSGEADDSSETAGTAVRPGEAIADNSNGDDHGDDNDFIEEEKEPEVRQHLTDTERKPLVNFNYAMKLRFGNHIFDLERAVPDEALKNIPAEIHTDNTAKTHTITVSKDSNGKTREFVQVCCSNLGYLRFGQFALSEKYGQDPTHALYLQGERTAGSDLPQSGKAQYTGSWTGFIKMEPPQRNAFGNPDYTHNATMANLGTNRTAGLSTFSVDFDSKKLNGALIGADSRKVFSIEADINGSGFKGRGYTDGHFSFDPGNQGGGYRANIQDAKVEGGFYGPGAQELGGTLIYNGAEKTKQSEDVRAGAVFGAQKQN